MKKIGLCVLLAALASPVVLAQDCGSLLQDMKLPEKVGTQGKPRMIKWEEVDKVLE
ncbi:MAG: hypothetical protein P8Z74_14400 [Acidobacteriota bacterium]